MTRLNQEEIKEYIPHREPFLFIDELTDIEKLKKATGVKIFTQNDNFFRGHFETNADFKDLSKAKTILCGGGRKNKFLVNLIRSYNKTSFKNSKYQSQNIKLIDDYGIDGDFVESQAFAYLAVRSYLKLPISFPATTGCKKPTTGGKIIKFK